MPEYKLHLGDCLKTMKEIKDKSVDFVFYDPPYNVGKNYGDYKDNLPPEEYKSWMRDVTEEVRRVAKHGFAVYVGSKLTRLFFEFLPDAHLIIIHKRAIGTMEGKYFLQYHSLFVVGKPIIPCKDLWDDVRLPGEGYFFREERYDHPGLTALALTKKILYHFTEKGNTVLDPFAGVGTTAVACVQLERNFIGYEISENYYKIAERRIREAAQQPLLEFERPEANNPSSQSELF